jgi:type IV fimbrial biogenesis protein FimT
MFLRLHCIDTCSIEFGTFHACSLLGYAMCKALRILQTVLMSTMRLCLSRKFSRIVPDPQGFTVVDLVIGMAMMGILATVAVPNMQPLMTTYRLNGAARDVMGDLMAARMKAVRQHRKVKVFFTDDHLYHVCDDANGDNAVDNCEGSAQLHDLQTNYAGVSVSATNHPTFSATGTAAGNTTITLTNTTGTKSIAVSITGQVKIN